MIWVLLDDRQANSNQSLGVANALRLPYETKQIKFNKLIKLPNFLLGNGIAIRNKALIAPPYPDIIIATGRKLASVAAYIKHKNPQTFIAQIQYPPNAKAFDLIAVPQHDKIKPAKNIIETVGAPHLVTLEKLSQEADIWREQVSHLPQPYIVVLLGGNVRGRKFTSQNAEELIKSASELTNSIGGSLLITTSRRTDKNIAETIRNSITAPYYLYDLHNPTPVFANEVKQSQANKAMEIATTALRSCNDGKNPFYGFLGLAEAVIVTGDSVSMCSEACATGKPVFIYIKPEFVPKKHLKFLNLLFELKIAKLLENNNKLFIPSFRLDDSSQVAREIITRH